MRPFLCVKATKPNIAKKKSTLQTLSLACHGCRNRSIRAGIAVKTDSPPHAERTQQDRADPETNENHSNRSSQIPRSGRSRCFPKKKTRRAPAREANRPKKDNLQCSITLRMCPGDSCNERSKTAQAQESKGNGVRRSQPWFCNESQGDQSQPCDRQSTQELSHLSACLSTMFRNSECQCWHSRGC